MIRGIYTNAAAMISLQLRQDVTANNVANANTTGFKKDGVFRKYLIDHDTILKQNATDFRSIEDVDGVITNYAQGQVDVTSNPLDVAIIGDGFFVVQTPQGERYTRNGNFQIDQNGYLVTGTGYFLKGVTGDPIRLAGGNVHIGNDGTVSVNGNLVGILQIVDFAKPYKLNKMGDGLFEAAPGSATPMGADRISLRQGCLERSNVEVVEEMVNIIKTSRDFESNQKSIQMQDTTLDRAVNDVGRVQRV